MMRRTFAIIALTAFAVLAPAGCGQKEIAAPSTTTVAPPATEREKCVDNTRPFVERKTACESHDDVLFGSLVASNGVVDHDQERVINTLELWARTEPNSQRGEDAISQLQQLGFLTYSIRGMSSNS